MEQDFLSGREFAIWQRHANERFDTMIAEMADMRGEIRGLSALMREQNGRVTKTEYGLMAIADKTQAIHAVCVSNHSPQTSNERVSWNQIKWVLVIIGTSITGTLAVQEFIARLASMRGPLP